MIKCPRCKSTSHITTLIGFRGYYNPNRLICNGCGNTTQQAWRWDSWWVRVRCHWTNFLWSIPPIRRYKIRQWRKIKIGPTRREWVGGAKALEIAFGRKDNNELPKV